MGTADEPIAIAQFDRCAVHRFVPANDEAFASHPLAKRGLHPYGTFRIERASWIRKLERVNSVHSRHRPEHCWELQHVVFAFHDSTFECIGKDFEVTTARGSINGMPEMQKRLGQ